MAKKLFFLISGLLTLACSLAGIIYRGTAALIFLPMAFALLLAGGKLKSKTGTPDKRLLLKRIKLLMQGKSDAYLERRI